MYLSIISAVKINLGGGGGLQPKKPKKTSPKFESCGSLQFFWVATPQFSIKSD